MNFKGLLTILVAIVSLSWGQAQDTVFIAGGISNAGLLETSINTSTNPNAVYKLEAGAVHFTKAPINFDDSTATLTIVGATDGPKPFIVPLKEAGTLHSQHVVRGSLTLKNIYFSNKTQDNTILPNGGEGIFLIETNDQRVEVDNCVIEFLFVSFLQCKVNEGLSLVIRNNYFRDLFSDEQWWRGRVFDVRRSIDTLIFENNTVTGGGLPLLQQGGVCMYGFINHNTFVNNHKYVFLNVFWYEAYFTNNLFVNCNWVGEDFNINSGGQDPDANFMGIIGIDTVDADVVVPAALRTDSVTIDPQFADFSTYKIYIAENVVFNDPLHDAYYDGDYNSEGSYPVSYLTWLGQEGPHEVENVPSAFLNDRTQTLIDEYPNIVAEGNQFSDPSLATPGIANATVAEQLAIWNRLRFQVPEETRTPDFTDYYSGDFDGSTLPGVEEENSSSPGINKISDFVEDYSYSASLTSSIDGLVIGALHWTDVAYDPSAAQSSVEGAYEMATNVSVPQDVFAVKNYPNPFSQRTTIEFTLPQTARVSLRVLNMMGEEVLTVLSETMHAGIHQADVDARQLSSGIYLYELRINEQTVTGKMNRSQ